MSSARSLPELDGAYRVGAGDSFILEACEYQDSFLSFVPNIAVVLNIDMDHPDYFHSLEQIITSFSRYLEIASDGYAVANLDDANVRAALDGYRGKIVGFGLDSPDRDFTAANISYTLGCPEFDIIRRGEFFVHVKLSVTGRHNIMNALASAAVADICKVSPEHIAADCRPIAARSAEWSCAAALSRIRARRCRSTTTTRIIRPRFERRCPARSRWERSGSLWCSSRTPSRAPRRCSTNSRARSAGVELIVTEIYAARETNDVGVSAAKLADSAGGIFIPTLPPAPTIYAPTAPPAT